FQAEDGIRDLIVTGVQTCLFRSCDSSQASSAGSAKTISPTLARSTLPPLATSAPHRSSRRPNSGSRSSRSWTIASLEIVAAPRRSEERRVGKGAPGWWGGGGGGE